MKNDDKQLLKSASNVDERLTFGIILRGHSDDIKKLKSYIENEDLVLVFKKLSLDNLYIINSTEFQELQHLQEKNK